jgi:serine/threonine-protein kinase
MEPKGGTRNPAVNICPQCKRQYPDSIAFCPLDGVHLEKLGPDEDSAHRAAKLGNRRVGSYLLEEVLAEGGMGVVFLARHVKLGRKVAVKMLRPEFAANPRAITRFFREARAVNAIQHENIITITDFIEDPRGDNFYVMELLEGRSIKKLLAQAGSLPVPRALSIALQVADAMAAVHRAGIIHRDLKPDNIFLISLGDRSDFVKLLDFGISKLVEPDADAEVVHQTAEGTILGTPEYMSPEQASGQPVDFRADIYSLGVLLYEMLTGRKPITGRSFSERICAVVTVRPAPPSQIEGLGLCLPRQLESLIMKCLEKDPERRPQSMEAVAAAIRDIGLSESVQCESVSLEQPVPKIPARRSYRLTGIVAALLVLIGLAIGAAFLLDSQDARSRTAPPAGGTPTAAAPVSISFESQPPGAAILVAGQQQPLGVTPLRASFGRAQRQQQFELNLAGYAPEHVTLGLDRDGQVSIVLRRTNPEGKPPQPEPGKPKPNQLPHKPGKAEIMDGTVDPFKEE